MWMPKTQSIALARLEEFLSALNSLEAEKAASYIRVRTHTLSWEIAKKGNGPKEKEITTY